MQKVGAGCGYRYKRSARSAMPGSPHASSCRLVFAESIFASERLHSANADAERIKRRAC
jgi:hypothetical protein